MQVVARDLEWLGARLRQANSVVDPTDHSRALAHGSTWAACHTAEGESGAERVRVRSCAARLVDAVASGLERLDACLRELHHRLDACCC